MWEFLNQYGWYFFMFGMMFFMHRRGMGCCGGHQQDQKNVQDQHETISLIPFEEKK